jgi:2-keto-4-pentenoate hydratase/2-oxohepta-3-ene-1,7-dioic acid hydratase in catechol pathway
VAAGLFRARDAQGRERGAIGGPGDACDVHDAIGGGLDAAAAWLLRGAQPSGPRAEFGPALLPGRPGKALCVGRNFAEHARELGNPVPEELIWFAKLPSVLAGPDAVVTLPAWLATRVDPEAEVVALVGRALGDGATAADGETAIAAYALGLDLTARGVQGEDKQKGWPWTRSKNLPGFGVIGPAWVPAHRLREIGAIRLEGLVNGTVRQSAPLAQMLRGPGQALAEIARWTPLEPGDVIFLGTPAGVAPISRGDALEVRATGLGRLACRIA